jgi:hypothetical protein
MFEQSAENSGRDQFVVRGQQGDWATIGCTTGCYSSGEIRFDLARSFGAGSGFYRLNNFYREQPKSGQVTMAHELAHMMVDLLPGLEQDYMGSRGWWNPGSTGGWGQDTWVDRTGNRNVMDNPHHHLVHMIALYVSAGNSWSRLNSPSMVTSIDTQFLQDLEIAWIH